jgi:hypothetical protein
MRRTPQHTQDINRDFQQKERQEFESIPDTKVRRRGERELYTPNNDDDYAIINTRNGWKRVVFITVEDAIPSNDVGENGEHRILSTSSSNSLLVKSNDIWHELNFEDIASAIGLDSLAITTVGNTSSHSSMTSESLTTVGLYNP